MHELIRWTWEAGDESFTVIARDQDEAFYKAEQEAAARGQHDAQLRLVDEEVYDPSGGDGDDD